MAKKSQASFRWEESFHAKVDARAKLEGLSHTAFVIKALQRYMDEVVDVPAIHTAIQSDIQLSTHLAIHIDERVAEMLDSRIADIQQPLKNDLTPIEDKLKKIESLIFDSPSGQANSKINRIDRLERLFASLNRKIELEEQKLIKPSPPVKNISTSNSRRGKEITFNTASDGSIVLRSIKGTDLRTFKKLTDAQLNEMGIRKVEIDGGIKFYPID
jgi:hypothetical protein